MVSIFVFTVRNKIDNTGYEFTVTSAALNNALASLALQYTKYVNSDFNTCEVMKLVQSTNAPTDL